MPIVYRLLDTQSTAGLELSRDNRWKGKYECNARVWQSKARQSRSALGLYPGYGSGVSAQAFG